MYLKKKMNEDKKILISGIELTPVFFVILNSFDSNEDTKKSIKHFGI